MCKKSATTEDVPDDHCFHLQSRLLTRTLSLGSLGSIVNTCLGKRSQADCERPSALDKGDCSSYRIWESMFGPNHSIDSATMAYDQRRDGDVYEPIDIAEISPDREQADSDYAWQIPPLDYPINVEPSPVHTVSFLL